MIGETMDNDRRIAEHPVLGTIEKGRLVSFSFDGRTVEGYEGEPIAEALKALGVMSANLLSAYRTAGIPGVGVKNLAKKGSKVLGIVGPGVINCIAVKTFAAVCPTLDTLKIKGRGQASIDRCIEFVEQEVPQIKTVTVCDTLEECVRDSDVMNFATSTAMGVGPESYPYVKTEWIKPGALLCLPGSANFDESLLLDPKTKLVVDNIKLYEAWADEYPYPTYNVVYILGSKLMDLAHGRGS